MPYSLSLVTISCFVLSSGTQLVVLEQGLNGYTGFEDTSIYSENQNAGGGNDGVFSGTNNQFNDRRALIRADLSFLPANAIIHDVELRMTVKRSGGNFGFFDLGLHRLTRGWGEGMAVGPLQGGFGGPAAPGDATWIANHHTISLWTNPGGDFIAQPSAIAPSGQEDHVTVWSSPGMIADVQDWVENPAANHGWIIISAIEGERQRVKQFHSSEALQDRPVLLVTAYVPDPLPAQTPGSSTRSLAALALLLGLATVWTIARSTRAVAG